MFQILKGGFAVFILYYFFEFSFQQDIWKHYFFPPLFSDSKLIDMKIVITGNPTC